jgi:hypothetical protein
MITENICPTMIVPGGTKIVPVTKYVPASMTVRKVSGPRIE